MEILLCILSPGSRSHVGTMPTLENRSTETYKTIFVARDVGPDTSFSRVAISLE